MIKLENINKYYFKGERHQIHVVNNVTLEFPNAGFVTILGVSGSGKTTLLNIIGGLDKFDSGSITYDDKVFNKYDMDEIDALRNEKMGYIFQNYLLINNFTVYDNLKVALEAMDVLDAQEQNKRIEHALKSVGLFKYRKKKVKNLSGGQMQRVSIARCIVKDSEVIIADEPTGNIDSENTIQIMNILKKLSETKLVILVTHEMNIARYYSDRIIQIKDGKIISDGLVSNNGSLNTQTDRKIYLGDLNNEKASTNKLNFELYVDEKSTESDLIIAVRNDTIYVKSSKKIVNVSESSIEFIDDCYKEPVDVVKDFHFDTSWYQKPEVVDKKKFFKTNFINGLLEFKNQGKSKIVFIIINIILGFLIGNCFVNLGKFTHVNQSEITNDFIGQVVTNKKTVYEPFAPNNDNNLYSDAFEEGLVDTIVPFSNETAYITFKDNFVFHEEHMVNNWGYPYQDDLKVIVGKRPYNNQIVIGTKLADMLLDIYGYGKNDYNKLLGLEYNGYLISGVVENDTMSVYYNPMLIYYGVKQNSRNDFHMIGNLNNYEGAYELISGNNPLNNNEVIIDKVLAEEININISDMIKLGDNDYKVVGLYKENNLVDLPSVLTTNVNLTGKTINLIDNSLYRTSYVYSFIYLPKNEYEILSGRAPITGNECIVNAEANLSIGESIKGYKIVGIYNKNYESGTLGSDYMYDNIIILNGENLLRNDFITFIFTDDAVDYFKEKNCRVLSLSEYQKIALRKQHNIDNIGLLVVSLFLLGVVVLLTYLTNRSRIINEIKTIGVYRSIGKSRKCLVYQKLGYNILMTSVSTVIGYVAAWIFSGFSNSMTKMFQEVVPTNPLIVILGIIVLYVIGIFIGLIPTKALIKKTPSEINSKYDI